MYLIAEIGTNHNGSGELAIEIARSAIDAGVSAVKMNYWEADLLVAKSSDWYAQCKKLELDYEVLITVSGMCYEKNVDFIIAPWAASLVRDAAMIADKLKIASGEITNTDLLQACRSTNKPTLLSTGMSTDWEVHKAAQILHPSVIMHCVSLYPCPYDSACLDRITELQRNYKQVPIGYSSHVIGMLDKYAAYMMGAETIEVHFNVAENLCADDRISLYSEDVKQLINVCAKVDQMKQNQHGIDFSMREKLRRGISGLRE